MRTGNRGELRRTVWMITLCSLLSTAALCTARAQVTGEAAVVSLDASGSMRTSLFSQRAFRLQADLRRQLDRSLSEIDNGPASVAEHRLLDESRLALAGAQGVRIEAI